MPSLNGAEPARSLIVRPDEVKPNYNIIMVMHQAAFTILSAFGFYALFLIVIDCYLLFLAFSFFRIFINSRCQQVDFHPCRLLPRSPLSYLSACSRDTASPCSYLLLPCGATRSVYWLALLYSSSFLLLFFFVVIFIVVFVVFVLVRSLPNCQL